MHVTFNVVFFCFNIVVLIMLFVVFFGTHVVIVFLINYDIEYTVLLFITLIQKHIQLLTVVHVRTLNLPLFSPNDCMQLLLQLHWNTDSTNNELNQLILHNNVS